MLKYLSDAFDGVIIVPMTLVNHQYYDEIISRLTKEGVNVKHYILYAEKDTIEKRLNKRLERGGDTWAKVQIDRCIYAFNHFIKEEKIITDNKSIDSIVEELAEKSGLTLLSEKRSEIRKLIDRSITLIKHIR
jgi:hypothetical protein